LEDAQRQRAARKQHGVQREQRDDVAAVHVQVPPSASSSLPCSPPKPPLLMMSTWSPSFAFATRPCSSSSSEPTSRPLAPSEATTAPASQPRSGGAYIHTASAAASDGPSVSRCTPIFIVAERGSSTATMRFAPTLR